ncbi:MAG: ZIP family metal transporter [Cyclobacteriaceae bacterium]
MIADVLILFSIALAGGLVAFYVPKINEDSYKLLLVFAGSYLFSITIIHILPELFHASSSPGYIGIFVLVGFFLQQSLEFFSSGVEHGHIHTHDKGHSHAESSAWIVLVALFAHSFLEGGLLAHPRTIEHHHDSNTLLWGIALHKAPEAFALMSVLLCEVKAKWKALMLLTIFALASPLGLYFSNYLLVNDWMSSQAFTFLFAVVSGNFLHISTTIVFESSLDHKFNARKMGVAVVAAALAVAAELVF